MSHRWWGAAVAGAVFGAVVSLVNSASSPCSSAGEGLSATPLGPLLRALSPMIDVGRAWAALAVALGWWTHRPVRSAVAGALALLGAVVAYYASDSLLLHQPISDFSNEIIPWVAAAVVLGALLGVVGALARRSGVLALLAALVVPVGAAVQMVVDPITTPAGMSPRPGTEAARVAARVLTTVLTCAALVRFARQRTSTAAPPRTRANP